MNDWQTRLIHLYLLVTEEHDTHLSLYSQRTSNNTSYDFTDVEAMTLYLFGLLRGSNEVLQIYTYASDHLRSWFPQLPSYQAFNARLNRLGSSFAALGEAVLRRSGVEHQSAVYLIDSMPITVANAARSKGARVAPGLADKGYNASKHEYYYGLKLHVLALARPGKLPLPICCGISGAATHDLEGLYDLTRHLRGGELYADRAYTSDPARRNLEEQQQTKLYAPIKKKPKGPDLDYLQDIYNRSISRVRQPIESLFSWISRRFDIQRASHARSTKGLMRHVFAVIAAAAIALVYP